VFLNDNLTTYFSEVAMKKIFKLSVILFTIATFSLQAQDNVLNIYLDADIANHNESATAIQNGIEVAFKEINNQLNGYKFAFKYLDHRGNVIRSKRNYQQFIADPNALAIFSGIHSPPLIKHRAFINENKALTLVPWAAGGPITRYPAKENWVFRLSIDDTRAGPVIIGFAMNNQQCQHPHLVLENSPWGQSNLVSMTKALKTYGINEPKVTRFSWNLNAKGARKVLDNLTLQGNDCIILVSNSSESAIIAQEMLKLPLKERLPIISHWGVTSGNFQELITHQQRSKLELHFIQSCFSFTNKQQSPLAKKVFHQLTKHSNGAITKPEDLKSAVGFIHAYDLTKVLIQAIKQAGITGNMQIDRNAIRLALESLNTPVNGLVKTYNKPFSIFDSATNINAHEALDQDSYCMGSFGANNEILIAQGH